MEVGQGGLGVQKIIGGCGTGTGVTTAAFQFLFLYHELCNLEGIGSVDLPEAPGSLGQVGQLQVCVHAPDVTEVDLKQDLKEVSQYRSGHSLHTS